MTKLHNTVGPRSRRPLRAWSWLAVGALCVTANACAKIGEAKKCAVTAVSVAPGSQSLVIGATTTLTVTPTSTNCSPTDLTPTWTTSAPSVASISGSGNSVTVTAVGQGSANISASVSGTTGSAGVLVTLPPVATVTVTPASVNKFVGETQQMTAVLRDVSNNVLTGRIVSFSSSTPAVASVDPATGVVNALAPGSTTITATSETKIGTATVNVALQPVNTVTCSPTPSSVVVGAQLPLSALLKDVNGVTLNNRTVTWGTSAVAVAQVSAAGVVTGISVGPVVITATSEGKQGSCSVTVDPVPVATVTPNLAEVYLQPGPGTGSISQQLSVVLKDLNGNTLVGRSVVWGTSNGAVATVSQTGLVNALTVGTVNITATSETKVGTVVVRVVRAFAVVDANQPSANSYVAGTNSAGGNNTVTRSTPGNYTITFAGIGNTTIGRSFAYLVNAKSGGPNSSLAAPVALCGATDGNGQTPLILSIRCESPVTGVARDAEFRVIVLGESSLAGNYAWTNHVLGRTTGYTPNPLFSANSASAAQTIDLNVEPGSWGNFLHRHNQGVTIPSQAGYVTGFTSDPGVTCLPRELAFSSLFLKVFCFNRATNVDVPNITVRVSDKRPGQIGGQAFFDVGGTAFGGGFPNVPFTSVRTGVGKYTVTFTGMVNTAGTLGIIVSGWGSNDWVHCAHWLVANSPVTIDVACFSKTGAFAESMNAAISVLVLQ